MPPPLSQAKIENVLSLLDSGQSANQIALKLDISVSCVSRLRSKYRPDLPKAAGGRPALLSPTTMRYAQRLITSGKADTAVDVSNELQADLHKSVSPQTVRRALKKMGMEAVRLKKSSPVPTTRASKRPRRAKS
ncbi:hypothetical protein L227DRAFT_654261 [Lentinus tigrinus ALCF2SS1-6]|uniref:Resolvase HTH domain-containing protein n=1 Tax=Lentinus tigrinus ALCF2SS1-6 TaxID=1328759 RepID=A0A5C2SD37_9APHY|nr:hypothetical protein L227DRAFT_654261 [Lentinus tigrinus ALCF2SS1-6]